MPGEELEVRTGAQAGQRVQVDGPLILGRETPGTLLGDDPLASRQHARLFRTAEGDLVVEDLGSANGTLVNGQPLIGQRILRPGDHLRLGETEIEVRAGGGYAQPVGIPPAQRLSETAAIPAPAPYGQPAAYGQPAPFDQPGQGAVPPGPPNWQTGYPPPRRGRGRKAGIIALVVVLLAGLGTGGYFLFSSDDKKADTQASAPSDCGANIGAGQQVGAVAYVESNTKQGNSVLLIPYHAGDMAPLPISQCATSGTGSADLSDSGVLDANNQVILNADHTLLFAVNQGSDTIAVFRVAKNGALTAVEGSPFASGGKAPAALGLSGDTLVVTNKAQDGVRDLTKEQPVYTTFKVSSQGRLTPVDGSRITADPGSTPTDAYVPAGSNVVFSTEESGPIRAFSIDSSGRLQQASGSPYDPEDRVFAKGFDPKKKFALGLAALPSEKKLYVSYSTVPALVVYSYDTDGSLTYETAILNSGSYLPCWNVITPNGKFLYTANADTNNVTAFSLDDPTDPQQIQTFAFDTPGNPWNSALDPNGRYLFVNTPRDTLKVPEGEGNTQHVLKIADDGTLTEVGKPVKLPVPVGVNPQGLAVLDVG